MKKLRLGVFGVGVRGRALASTFMLLNCDIVAVCDKRESELARAKAELGADIAAYRDFDSFIDAVAETAERIEPVRRFFNDALSQKKRCPWDVGDWE